MDILELLVATITCMLGITDALSASRTLPHVYIARDDCETQCGNMNIPFPFGIGSNCSLNEWFEIFCDNSTTPHKPILKHTQWEVFSIPDYYSYPEKQPLEDFLVQSPISFSNNCGEKKIGAGLNLTGSPFDFSAFNTFVAVSCGVMANFSSISIFGNELYLSTRGCKSTCSSESSEYDHNRNSTTSNRILCNGIDCCEIPAGEGYDAFDISFDDSSSNITSKCKFSFLVDNDHWSSYKNSPESSIANIRNMSYAPIRLYWSINDTDIEKIFGSRNMSRSESENRFLYCDRVDEDGDAYPLLQCYCRGLRGNPYLSGGCSQDIDECEETPKKCGGGATCVNTHGSYHCSFRRKNILIGVGSALGAFFLLFSSWGLYKFIKKRKDINRKREFFKCNGGLLLQQQISSVEGNVQKTKVFSSDELQKATDNFSIDRILGQGGQGTVYKGMLDDGKIVAIKKSKIVDEAQLSEFINEVVILSQINHRNVVQLLGCCLETEVPLLVYEFIPNGTLSQYIHDGNENFPFIWKMRLQVAVEVAGALSYLHSAASFPIYHRDIKSTNILLDEKYRAKVADFGTSRTILWSKLI